MLDARTTKRLEKLRSLLVERNATLAVAESLTAGNVMATFATVEGVSECLEGGVITYNLEQKVRQLGVNRQHAEAVNCVSQRVADEMARGVAERFESTFAVAATGYAQSAPERGIPRPMAFLAVWSRDMDGSSGVCHQLRWEGDGNRFEVQRAVALVALEMVLDETQRQS